MLDARQRLLQGAFGIGVSVALLAALVAPLWLIELAVLGLTSWLTWWMATVPVDRLKSRRGLPRLGVFAPLAVGIAANLYLIVLAGRWALILNVVLFVVAMVVGGLRVVNAAGSTAA